MSRDGEPCTARGMGWLPKAPLQLGPPLAPQGASPVLPPPPPPPPPPPLPTLRIDRWTRPAGYLVSVDSYMNLQLASTEEYIDGQFTGNLGEVLIRWGRWS